MSRRTLAISLAVLLGLALVGAHLLTRVDGVLVPESPSPVAAARPEPSISPTRRAPAADASPAPPIPSTSRSTGAPTTTTTNRPPVPVVVASAADVANARSDSTPRDELPAPYEFSKEGLRGAIEEKLPEIRECYEAWQKQNPAIAGRLMVGFDIAADNSGTAEVQRIELLDGGVGQPLMEGCVLNAFQDIRFEEPPGGGRVKVRYPIDLGPGSEDAGAR